MAAHQTRPRTRASWPARILAGRPFAKGTQGPARQASRRDSTPGVRRALRHRRGTCDPGSCTVAGGSAPSSLRLPSPCACVGCIQALGGRCPSHSQRAAVGGRVVGRVCYFGDVAASYLVVRLEGWKSEVGGLSGLGMSYTCGSVPSPCCSCT